MFYVMTKVMFERFDMTAGDIRMDDMILGRYKKL